MKLKKGEIKIEDDVRDQVEAYARENYKRMFGDKPLIIKEFDKIFTVTLNKDASPLILGKGILSEDESITYK